MESHAGQYEDYDAWRVSHKVSLLTFVLLSVLGLITMLIAITPLNLSLYLLGLFTFVFGAHCSIAITRPGLNRRLFEFWNWNGEEGYIYEKRPTEPDYESAADKLNYGKDKRI